MVKKNKRILPGVALLGFVVSAMLGWAKPCSAYATYSGASMGSNGTTFGWGVTDVPAYGYIHTAYVWTTLRSPNGRIATTGWWVQATNTVTANVLLAWDSNDLGDYRVESTHKAWCRYMGWFINN